MSDSAGLALERRLVAEAERGRRVSLQADGDRLRAEARLAAAEQARAEAVQAEVRGAEDAAERLGVALQAIHDAAQDIAANRERAEAGAEVAKQARARLHQVREFALDELAPSAEALTQVALEKQAALAPLLREYAEAYAAAVRRWRELLPGCRALVEKLDAELGQYRNDDRIIREAAPPEFPIEPDALAKLLTVAPRPVCMVEGYEPGKPPEAYRQPPQSAGPAVLWPGDEGHQPRTVKTAEQDPAEVVMANARHGAAPSERELVKRQYDTTFKSVDE